MKKILALALAAFVAAGHVAAETGEWQSRGVDNGVALFERSEPGQDFKSFRGVVKVKAPMRAVLALVLVRETFPSWVASVLEDRTLPNAPDASLCYMVIAGKWPAQDRDVVAKVTVAQDAKSLAVSVVAQDTDPSLVPAVEGRVRMPRLYSGFTVRPISATETEVQLDGQANPGGNVPPSISNLVSRNLPRDTLVNLRNLVEGSGKVDMGALDTNLFASLSMKQIKLPN